MRRFGGPMLGCIGASDVAIVTDEMRSAAFRETREQLKTLEGLRVELGLAPAQLEIVADIYTGVLASKLLEADLTKQKARNKKQREKMKAWQDAAQTQHRAWIGGTPPYLDDEDDE